MFLIGIVSVINELLFCKQSSEISEQCNYFYEIDIEFWEVSWELITLKHRIAECKALMILAKFLYEMLKI